MCCREVDASYQTASSEVAFETAEVVAEAVARSVAASPPGGGPLLARAAHVVYLRAVLESVGGAPSGYDATRVWLTYWALAGLDTLGALEGVSLLSVRLSCVAFLSRCQVPRGGWGGAGAGAGASASEEGMSSVGGGFGGGPMQEAHAASTFAALASLALLSRDGGLAIVDVVSLSAFYNRLRVVANHAPDAGGAFPGAFRVTRDGEADVRGAYCVAAGAALAGIPLRSPLFEGTSAVVARALSYEGGAAGEAGGEAHGGYTYCALAAMELMDGGWAADGVDIALPSPPALALNDAGVGTTLRWVARRQLATEGGFSGRANKVVDACYTFWNGAAAVIAGGGGRGAPAPGARAAWSGVDAARYVLRAAQVGGGGFRDKPGKLPDAYHTCYALAGLAIAQGQGGAVPADVGDRLNDVHPLFGLRPIRLKEAAEFWRLAAQSAS